jgi:hypothetical protein
VSRDRTTLHSAKTSLKQRNFAGFFLLYPRISGPSCWPPTSPAGAFLSELLTRKWREHGDIKMDGFGLNPAGKGGDVPIKYLR